jgi:hypothetical protein
MESITVFLVRNDIWIYILCTLGLFWYGSELVRAQRQLRSAIFNLERERGHRRRANALVFILIFGGLAGGVAYVNLAVAPNLPPELLRSPTPTPDPLRPALASPTPGAFTRRPEATATPPLVPTITLPGDLALPPAAGTPGSPAAPGEAADDGAAATESPTPTLVAVAPAGNCPSNANFSLPLDGATVNGLVTFTGNASAPGFAFYKLEVIGPQTDGAWASLLGRTIFQPTVNGVLGSADFTGWLPGTYQVRLVVVDSTSNEVGACTIRLEVEG